MDLNWDLIIALEIKKIKRFSLFPSHFWPAGLVGLLSSVGPAALSIPRGPPPFLSLARPSGEQQPNAFPLFFSLIDRAHASKPSSSSTRGRAGHGLKPESAFAPTPPRFGVRPMSLALLNSSRAPAPLSHQS